LFRAEALEANRSSRKIHSDILLILPRSYKWIVALILVFSFSAIVLAVTGSYTRRVSVKGELALSKGAIPVYLPVAGFIEEYYVKEDEPINKNDPLLLASTEVYGVQGRERSSESIELLMERKQLLQKQIEKNQDVYLQNFHHIENQIKNKRNEQSFIDLQINSLKEKSELLAEGLERYRAVHRQKAISDEALREQLIIALNAQIDYNERQMQLSGLASDVDALLSDREKMKYEHENRLLQIRSEQIEIEEKIVAIESQRGIILKAPASGRITAVQGVSGSYYDTSRPVVFIVPADSRIEARLLIPAAAIGYIKKGDAIRLRYSAYAYQKFGQGAGTVYAISEMPLLPEEISLGTKISLTEPMFLVKATIREQMIIDGGVSYALRPGITVDADILLENERLFKWILRPFLAIFKNLES